MDFYEQARVLFPWLPDELVQVYADAWVETDDQQVAFATVVADPRFDDFFPGLKRADGTVRMAPAEYVSTVEGYNRVLLEAGLNPDVFTDRLVDWIEGDVSVIEAQDRVSRVRTQVLDNTAGVREFYATNYGLELTDEAIVASALDPTLGDDILNRRIDVARVGGQAADSGFRIGRGFAQRLVDADVTQADARGLFQAAGLQLPGLQRSARRFGVDRTFDLEDFAGAAVFGDPTQARRIDRLRRQEQALFTRQNVRRDRVGGLTGLTET